MTPTVETNAGPSIEPVSILLVDDDPGILETLVDIFEDMGFRAQTAATGGQALTRIQERAYNLALLDIRLPDMDGTELLAHARRLQPDMKCIMATGNTTLQYAVDSLNEGAYAYLLKPVDVPNVKETVRRALDQQRLELQNRLLLDITDAALATLELDELLPSVLQRFVDYYHADGGVIYLIDAATRQLVPHAALGLSGGAASAPIQLGEGLAGLAGQQNRIQAASDGALANDRVAAAGVQAALAAPLPAQERMIGAIRLDWQRPRIFTAEEKSLLHILSERAAIQIDNARRYEDERHLAHSLVERIGLEERLELISNYLMSLTNVSRCIVWLANRESLSFAKAIGAEPQLERRMRRIEMPLTETSEGVRHILESGQATVVADLHSTNLLPTEADEAGGARSALLVPLRFEGRAIGLVALDQPLGERPFSERQVRQAMTVAFMSAGAIQQAKIIQAERNMARTLAESFLTVTPHRSDLEISSRYEPASDVEQIGGDYYDFIEFDRHRMGVVLGDVCGKGLTAAIYTGKAKDMLYAYARENFELAREANESPSPRWVITRLNRALYSQMSEECMFITMIYGVLDTRDGSFTYTNAAHPSGILYQPSSGSLFELTSGGVLAAGEKPASDQGSAGGDERPTNGMVGAFEAMEFTEHTVVLDPGAVLAVFTDGVTEARSNGVMLESEGVQEVVSEVAGEPASDIANAIYHRAREFAAGALRDDVAIVVLKNAASA